MASICKEIRIAMPPATAWAAIREFGAAHRLFAGVVSDCKLDGAIRTVTFANGFVVREQLVGIDETRRRLAYTVIGGRASHHHASLQVADEAGGGSRVIWITDLLPDEVAPIVDGLMTQGADALARALAT